MADATLDAGVTLMDSHRRLDFAQLDRPTNFYIRLLHIICYSTYINFMLGFLYNTDTGIIYRYNKNKILYYSGVPTTKCCCYLLIYYNI